MTIQNVSNPKLLKSVNEMRASVNHQVSVFNFRKKKGGISGGSGRERRGQVHADSPAHLHKKVFPFRVLQHLIRKSSNYGCDADFVFSQNCLFKSATKPTGANFIQKSPSLSCVAYSKPLNSVISRS